MEIAGSVCSLPLHPLIHQLLHGRLCKMLEAIALAAVTSTECSVRNTECGSGGNRAAVNGQRGGIVGYSRVVIAELLHVNHFIQLW